MNDSKPSHHSNHSPAPLASSLETLTGQSLPLEGDSPSVHTNASHWPEDYELLDQGQLRVSRHYLSVFESLGWHTFEDVFTTPLARRMRRIQQRENSHLKLPYPQCDNTVSAFMKRHTVSNLWRWLREVCTGHILHSDGIAEADAVAKAQAAGIETMTIIAAGEARGPRPWQARSFFISEAITGAHPADLFWTQHITDDASGTALLNVMADKARALHNAGLFHRDLYWCHFFVRQAATGCFRVRLIDLQRLRYLPRWCCAYARLKDLAQYYRSAPPPEEGGPTFAQLCAWYSRYRGKPALVGFDRCRFALIRFRTALYRLKDRKR
jgi:hypothetical protein